MDRLNDCLALHTTNPADRVALRGVRLTGTLSAMSYQAILEQTFVNLEPHAIEAVYTFPLPEGAAVCGFEVITADRVLTGTIDEAEKAIERYDDAVTAGHGAFLVEQDRPDVFTARVGNLKPRQAATIRLTFVGPLEVADKAIRVAFPTTVAPRYVTAAGTTDPIEAAIDGDALNPPHVLSVPYGLTLRLRLDLGRNLRTVESPTHAITVTDDVVSFTGNVAEMNRDFVLSLPRAKEQEPVVQAAKGPDGADYLAVTFVPEFDALDLGAPAPTETVFVLDCSGSMQGESLAQAVAALELCLRGLNEGDTFNVCRFGSMFELLASEPLRYTDKSLAKAIKWVRASGDMGGTELHGPLQAVFFNKPVVGQARTVIVLTDGQVSNEPAVIELARQHRAHNRIFSFGIGSACSAFLVKGLARATGGASEFISGNERIEEKVLRTFSRAASPMVHDVAIDWRGADVQTLAEIPPIFDGDALTIFGRCAGRLPATVSLTAVTAAGPRAWSVGVPRSSDDNPVVARMWARRTIQSLEEVNGVHRTSVSDRRDAKARSELVRLSKEFNLLCSLTTFIAIEHRSLAERNEGRPALRRVPVELAKGWGEMVGDTVCGVPVPCVAAPLADQMPSFYGSSSGPAPAFLHQVPPGSPPKSAPAKKSAGLASRLRSALGGASAKPAKEPDRLLASPPTGGMARDATDGEAFELLAEENASPKRDWLRESSSTRLMALLATQAANGSFAPERDLLDAVTTDRQRDFAEIATDVATRFMPTKVCCEDEEVVWTLLVTVLLLREFPSDSATWKRAFDKAVRYVAKALAAPAAEIEQFAREQKVGA